MARGNRTIGEPVGQRTTTTVAQEIKPDPKLLEEANRRRELANIQQQTRAGGQEFEALAQRYLGGTEQFQQSQAAQEQLARREAMAASQGAQRALAGKLAAQGVRGGAAAAAQMGAAGQGAALQAQIGQQMIAQRADKEQALKQQLLSAVLAGRQFGNAQIQQLLANQANIAAAKAAKT